MTAFAVDMLKACNEMEQYFFKGYWGDDMKLLVFKGSRLEDPEQHWFLCDVFWNVKKVMDNDIKMA